MKVDLMSNKILFFFIQDLITQRTLSLLESIVSGAQPWITFPLALDSSRQTYAIN